MRGQYLIYGGVHTDIYIYINIHVYIIYKHMFEYANVCVCVCPLQHRVTDVPTTSVSMIQLVPAIMELPIEMAWLLLDTSEISRCLAGC